MKRIVFLLTVCCALTMCAQSAAHWQSTQSEELKRLVAELPGLVKEGRPAFDRICREIRSNYATPPLASTRLAALTQYVMRQREARRDYADALLTAVRQASEADVKIILLDQLRWCGYPEQDAALASCADADAPRDVKAMIELVRASLAPLPSFSDLKKPTHLRAPEVLVQEMRSDDPTRMRLAAIDLLTLESDRFARELGSLLKSITAAAVPVLLPVARTLTVRQLETSLVHDFHTYSPDGRRMALTLFAERCVGSTLPLAKEEVALNADTLPAALKVVGAVGGTTDFEWLMDRGCTSEEAWAALASIGRRDTTGRCLSLLAGRLQNVASKEEDRWLPVAARLGGPSLLAIVEKRAMGSDPEQALAAVRALTEWAGRDAFPLLMRMAIAAPDPKCQTLAVRAVVRKSGEPGIDKPALRQAWHTIRILPGKEEHKRLIDEALAKDGNVR